MSNLFSQKNVRNNPHRDGFDLSFNNLFTAPLGALLPVMYKDVMPGDKFDINLSWFTRSQPATAPAYTRLTEYCDFFFVPYHFLWRYFPDFITQTNSNNWATSVNPQSETNYTQLPYITPSAFKKTINDFNNNCCPKWNGSGSLTQILDSGFNIFHSQIRLFDMDRLLRYLNMGKIAIVANPSNSGNGTKLYTINPTLRTRNNACNVFPLLAYNKIYADFYRNQQWEKPAPNTYNVDYITPQSSSMEIPITYNMFGLSARSESMFDLKYCNYNKDYFTGIQPNKQFGEAAMAAPLQLISGNQIGTIRVSNSAGDKTAGYFLGVGGNPGNTTDKILSFNANEQSGISALAIRQAEFLQKWKEITQSGGQNYVDQMQKHFGVTPNRDIAHMCTYLGGVTKNFGADEVVNTNLADGNEALICGKMVNTAQGHLTFNAKEHGIIMAIYHLGVLPSYDNYMPSYLTKLTATDFVIPEMDNIGMQPVYDNEVSYDIEDKIRGYVPRYSEYKTSVDEIHGSFVDTYRNWVTPITENVLGKFRWKQPGTNNINTYVVSNYVRLKQSPNVMDKVFNVVYDGTPATDQFFVNMDFGIKAVRNISRDGLPY